MITAEKARQLSKETKKTNLKKQIEVTEKYIRDELGNQIQRAASSVETESCIVINLGFMDYETLKKTLEDEKHGYKCTLNKGEVTISW